MRTVFLYLAAMPLHIINIICVAWPFLLLAWLFMAETTPHLRWTYSYTQVGKVRVFTACTYLGIRGVRVYDKPGNCPLITILRKEGA